MSKTTQKWNTQNVVVLIESCTHGRVHLKHTYKLKWFNDQVNREVTVDVTSLVPLNSRIRISIELLQATIEDRSRDQYGKVTPLYTPYVNRSEEGYEKKRNQTSEKYKDSWDQ